MLGHSVDAPVLTSAGVLAGSDINNYDDTVSERLRDYEHNDYTIGYQNWDTQKQH